MNKNKNFLMFNLLKKDQRGTDKILSMYWFAILVIIAGGVFAMVYNFYGAPYDIRESESSLLANRIADCVSQNGKINPDFFSEGNFNSEIEKNILEECTLNFNVEMGYQNVPQYFFEIEFYKPEDLSAGVFSISEGNLNWKTDCLIKKENNKEYERTVKCTERRLYALDSGNNQYLIKILSGVGKSEKNVKN